jgi:predicted ABC-type ATPase
VLQLTLETVMSHDSKLTLMRDAKARGFRIILIYITTVDPVINCERVKLRVERGGHDVPEDRIINRYFKSLDQLKKAVDIAHYTELYDNSSVMHPMTCHAIIDQGRIETRHPESVIPQWIIDLLETETKRSA